MVIYGLLAFAGAYGCLYWAMQEVPAGVARRRAGDRPAADAAARGRRTGWSGSARRALAGALIAVAGSALIFFQPGSVDFGWGSFVLLVVAALAAAESVVISKRVGPEHPVMMNFVAMSAGAAVLLVVAALAGESLTLPEAGKTQLAVAYLGVATVALFLFVLVVVQRWTASSTSYVFVLMPVVAVDARRLDRRRADHRDDDPRRRDRLRGRLPRRAHAA